MKFQKKQPEVVPEPVPPQPEPTPTPDPTPAPTEFAVTLVPSKRGGALWDIVILGLDGDRVVKRHVHQTIEGKQYADEEAQRIVTRVLYFGEGTEPN